MLQRSFVVRWVPRYIRQVPRVRQKKEQRDAVAMGRSKAPSKRRAECSAVSERDGGVARAAQAKRLEITEEGSTVLESPVSDVSRLLLRKAETLLDSWQKLNMTMTISGSRSDSLMGMKNSSSSQKRDAVAFMAQTEVFAVVKGMIHLSTPHEGSLNRCEEDNKHDSLRQNAFQEYRSTNIISGMVVIPDEATNDAVNYLAQIGRHRVGKVQDKVASLDDSFPISSAIFSLHEVVVFLELYNAMDCEDGELLLRLLEELRRIVFSTEKEIRTENHVLRECEEGVIPRLLLTLSSLGIVEENVLQRIVAINDGSILSRATIARYPESDLIRLLVAFNRFGLHHEPCFHVTAKTLRRNSLRNPLKSFCRNAVNCRVDAAPLGDGEKRSRIPSSMAGLTMNELLEALTAIALSLCREREVVKLLAATIVTAVEDEEYMRCSTKEKAKTREEDLGLLRTLQVHRAAKVCEQMDMPQPSLAHLLHRLSIRYGGLLADGGDVSLSPERVGFYDFITADLVKARCS
ncbi:hypothetical protein C3747_33g143 [Trypanosoma cruzi]|uniref:Uncharacterized protein n=2 Tax=Trypanosoma cruzi TaxID=5693 RepID=Q4DHL7_TRYCC|nr:hypothetical protein, conserved [Trypanosoma cruzi]EAN92010.1 hypothetical protein, conserved [Trypanosoma cruzi]PWV14836.1 hypothetical protein C3747_33g143 [Trypanosoma cruzi]RNC60712.1 hypothetical protein TcCL_ESM01535 [Trypanosoma cruzi]|eukprot:XP_813861.1 hypothetical protein [Trypanosoma cruzi strain CL Brener]